MKSDIQGVLLRSLGEISENGYSVGVGFNGREPYFVRSTYEGDWVEHYIANNLILKDPTIQFGLSKAGHTTWQNLEREFPDSIDFFSEARRFGLSKGNTLSVCIQGQVSILSCSGEPWGKNDLCIAKAALLALAVLAADPNVKKCDPLAEREKDVIYLMADGWKDQRIADHLELKVESVRARRRSAFQATGTTTIAQLISKVIKNDLI